MASVLYLTTLAPWCFFPLHRLVTLASGQAAGRLLEYEEAAPSVAAQTAYGIEAEVEGYPEAYDPKHMLFMDFRRHHSGVWDARKLTAGAKGRGVEKRGEKRGGHGGAGEKGRGRRRGGEGEEEEEAKRGWEELRGGERGGDGKELGTGWEGAGEGMGWEGGGGEGGGGEGGGGGGGKGKEEGRKEEEAGKMRRKGIGRRRRRGGDGKEDEEGRV